MTEDNKSMDGNCQSLQHYKVHILLFVVAQFEISSPKRSYIFLQVALKLHVSVARVLLPSRWRLRSSWIAILESLMETSHPPQMSVKEAIVFVANISRIQHRPRSLQLFCNIQPLLHVSRGPVTQVLYLPATLSTAQLYYFLRVQPI